MMIFKEFQTIRKKEFSKNILTLMTGTAAGQIISLVTIPILTRLFSPEEFGIFAVFMGLSSILISIACGRYELAIMLPKNNNNAYQIFIISFYFVIFFSLLSLGIIYAFQDKIAMYFKIETYKDYLYFIPLSVFISGIYLMLSNWFTRFKDFKRIAVSKVMQSGTGVISKISFGVLKFNSTGLIIGDIIGQFFSVLYLLFKNKKQLSLEFYKKDFNVMKKEFLENKNFPLFSMPMAFLNSISIYILIYVFTVLFTASIVGFYLQANKVITYPLNFLTTSFTSVFYQKLTTTANKLKLYLYSYLISFFSACIICFPFLFWGEEIFGFFLGKEWAYSGKMAQILIPITIAGFATRNVSSVFSLLKNQQISLIWQIIYLAVAIVIFYIYSGDSLEHILLYYSLFGAFMYVFLGLTGYLLLKKNIHKFSADFIKL
jgi:O-antigen/teichoic acid export membrane protein